jgi:cysteine desulfurase
MFNKRVFLDYASTTPVDSEVFNKMKKYFSSSFANAQSIHKEGLENKKVLNESREKVARLVQVKDNEVIFTAGGTESVNLGILGLANKLKKEIERPHIITTNIEHVAVLESCKYLEKNGFDITYLPVNENGVVTSPQIKEALKPETILVSVMLANNEIGTIMPIRDISRVIQKYKKENNKSSYPYLHTDASQAPNYLDVNVNRLGVDLMSLDGSKIYGPKGIGCLIKKNYVDIESISFGGHQEFGLRAGTENIPLIYGFALSLEKTLKIQKTEKERLEKLQKYFIKELQNKIPNSKINGSIKNRLPNNVNVCIPKINAEFVVIQLDQNGIACSSMTACRNMTKVSSSYVVESLDKDCADSSLRFSMGRNTKKSHIDKVIKTLSKIIDNV